MNWIYCCPECKARLDPDKSVVLIAEHKDVRVLAGLHPEPGNYEVHLPVSTKIEDGGIWEFFCPMCHTNLEAEGGSNFCELVVLRGGERKRLLFSKIAGEQATFVLSESTVSESYGKDIGKFEQNQLAQTKYIRY